MILAMFEPLGLIIFGCEGGTLTIKSVVIMRTSEPGNVTIHV